MSARKGTKKEESLRDALEFNEAIIATVREPLVVLDKDLRVIIANRSFYNTFQVIPEETEGQLIYDLGNKQWNITRLRQLLEDILPTNTAFEDFEVEHNFDSVGRKTMLLNARKIYREMNNVEMILLAIEDITQRKMAEDQLKQLASTDGLTGIANRHYFENTLDSEWRRSMRNTKPLALIMIDIDFFKTYNDLYGHLAGDSCLQKIAATIKTSLRRAGNFVARYGGEEFVVVLPDTSSDEAYLIAESLREKIDNLNIEHRDSKIGSIVTVSLGVAIVTPQRNSAKEKLISLADKALYKAKQEGRNRVVKDSELFE